MEGGGQRPEIAIFVLEDADLDQAVERLVDDPLRPGGEPFDPELGVVRLRIGRDFLEDRVGGGIARRRPVQQGERLEIRVDARAKGELRQHRAGHGAVQVPAGHLVEIAGLPVEEHQDKLLRQVQGRIGRRTVGHRLCPPRLRVRRAERAGHSS